MKKTVKVTYNADTLQTEIIVDGQPFDTSRINGKEIADWAYPFMMRKVKWNGFYDEMVGALGGEKAFDLVFKGSEEALAELKEAWEDAPVTIIDNEKGDKVVIIEYDADKLSTKITVNGQPFDTSRIEGREIEDWVYPFMMRKVKWDGIFEELAKVVGTEEYSIEFSGSDAAMKELMEECPEGVQIRGSQAISLDNSEIDVWYNKLYNKWIDMFYDIESEDEDIDISDAEWNKIVNLCQDSVNRENTKAMVVLACAALERDDEEELTKWFRKAAENGDSFAQLWLCLLYLDGDDENKAVEWLRKAAEQDFSLAQDMLGEFYYDGIGVKENETKAYEWYQKALKTNFPRSYYKLGERYRRGDGVDKDKEKAKELFQRGMKLGDESCKEAYNKMLKNGERIETAKKVGSGILEFLGAVGEAYAQGCAQAAQYNDNDDDEY